MNIEERAEQALQRPEDFAYYGDLYEEDGWGRSGLAVHRDSEALDRSNWETITEDLQQRFPGDFEIESANHWAVGWIDELRVRVKDESGNITDAFRAVVDWADALMDYPVADEDHYCRLENEELMEYLEQNVSYYWEQEEDAPDDLAELVARILFDDCSICRVDDIGDKDMTYAINQVVEGKHANT